MPFSSPFLCKELSNRLFLVLTHLLHFLNFYRGWKIRIIIGLSCNGIFASSAVPMKPLNRTLFLRRCRITGKTHLVEKKGESNTCCCWGKWFPANLLPLLHNHPFLVTIPLHGQPFSHQIEKDAMG